MVAHIEKSTLAGSITVPPSKSMAHRMLICAALASGVSHIKNVDYSNDIVVTLGAMAQLGAKITRHPNSVTMAGTAGRAGAPVEGDVACGESGSTLRFIIPLFALGRKVGQPVRLTGAPRLFQRPLTPYADIFARQGLPFAAGPAGVTLGGPLQSGEFALPGDVSSQFVSGLLLALPLLEGNSVIHITPPLESRSYIELTRSAQKLFGVHSRWQNAHTLHVPGGQQYTATDATVEGDWSQAVVPAAIAAVRGGVAIEGLRQDSAQGDTALLEILRRCGANVGWRGQTLLVTPPASGLQAPGEVDLADCPDLGPVLCALALFCSGTTRFVNAGRLRIKESDRIAATQEELCKLGGQVTSTQNTIAIQGGGPLRGSSALAAHNDHRIVMAQTVAALCGGLAVRISGADAIQKSWPSFFKDIAAIGGQVQLYDKA